MVSPQQDLAWRIGGPQGSGVDTAAGLFASACAVGGLHVFGRREYYSRLMLDSRVLSDQWLMLDSRVIDVRMV